MKKQEMKAAAVAPSPKKTKKKKRSLAYNRALAWVENVFGAVPRFRVMNRTEQKAAVEILAEMSIIPGRNREQSSRLLETLREVDAHGAAVAGRLLVMVCDELKVPVPSREQREVMFPEDPA